MPFASINSINPIPGTIIHKILAEIAQLLVVVEKLSFFELAILKIILQKKTSWYDYTFATQCI
jgi:TPP-dependent indolepyruvate ferredoxin oxidoreductase alpha subunit